MMPANHSQGTDLNRPLLMFSPTDAFRLGDAFEGALLLGASGSGKTTTSGKSLAYALLNTPMSGGLILTCKREETDNWIKYAKACGREQDLLIFNAESGHAFDVFQYEWARPGRGSADQESIIDLFSTLLSIGKQVVTTSGEAYWERASEKLLRHTLVVLGMSGEPMSLSIFNRFIEALPSRLEECDEEQWQNESYAAHVVRSIEARKDTLTEAQWQDLDTATQFLFKRWPQMDERPRSSIVLTFSGLADKFTFHPLRRLFCSGKCTFVPEMTTHQGRIIVVDFPTAQYGPETGRLIGVMLKLVFQRAWLRRDLSESASAVFLWQDEFQMFVSRRDNTFQQTCRSARVAVVCLTQNILNLSEELGEQQPGSKTKSFLGNLALKVFHQQNEFESAQYAADLIGKQYRFLDSYNAGASGDTSFGAAKQLVYNVEPSEFSRLTKPDSVNPISTAIVYQGGKTFNATITNENPRGSNHLTVAFSRDI